MNRDRRRPGDARSRRLWRALTFVLSFTLPTSAASAQILEIRGGSSSLFDAHGGTVTVRGRMTSTTIGIGQLGDELTLGVLARKSTRNAVFSLGDEAVDFQLPTDLFGGSRYLPVRGAGVEWTHGPSHARLLVGVTSQTLGAPFFRGATPDRPLVLAFYDRRVGSRWRLFSKTAISNTRTFIQGFAWQPRPFLSTAVAAGVGSDKPYLAPTVSLEQGWLTARAAYIRQGSGFRRLEIRGPMAAEPVSGNVAVTMRPARWWSVTGARQSLIDSHQSSSGRRQVTINELGAGINRAGFRLVTSLYDSHQRRGRHLGASISAGRRLTSALDVVVDYFRSDPSEGRATHSTVVRLQETVSPRLSLIQAVNRSGNQTSVHLGGEFLSNPLRASVTSQTVYAPLREGNPFVHVLGLDARVHLFDGVELQIGTYSTPYGQLRYTVSASYLHAADNRQSHARVRTRFPRLIVRGLVQDDSGAPISGAVIHLGSDVVVTDSDGRFFLRTNRGSRLTLRVAAEEFLCAGRFTVISAPQSVAPLIDGNSREVIVILRRM